MATAAAVTAALDYASQATRCRARISALGAIINHHETHGQVIDLRRLYARLGDVIAATVREELDMPQDPKPKPINPDELRRHAQRVIAAARVPMEAPPLDQSLRVSIGMQMTKASAAALRAHTAMSKGDRLAVLKALHESSQHHARATALLLGVQFDPSDDDDMLPTTVPA